ncbi:hypothetical protein SKAU_G00278340 [Synaphobranchus kaupii]|uniref:USP domain-containing protein n=1 Tax=Synaphobranchus kaupii TaxID=118154 RepID=A0A9Q1INS2_SYNKA|nr:hypothetical protein SKAU_G00278340 [Synaphobranchus kaupii]
MRRIFSLLCFCPVSDKEDTGKPKAEKKKNKKKWWKRSEKGMKAQSVSAEEPATTTICAEEQTVPTTGKAVALTITDGVHTHDGTEHKALFSDLTLSHTPSHPPSVFPSAPAPSEPGGRSEVKVVGWFSERYNSFIKFLEEHLSQNETKSDRLAHTLLGLQNFIKDIKREGCWMPNVTTHLLSCLVDLHSARDSGSSKQKTGLLKTLKKSISQNCRDFCGYEQQDAHEFLSAFLSQMKEEGFILSTIYGQHPYTCPIKANFEFDLLSTRTCLSCGARVSKTESYNSLCVDLVPGGSVQDSLALYFKVCEVECQCYVCFGQLASVEQKLQSLPRVLVLQLKRFSLNSRLKLVKLLDTLQISPLLSLQTQSKTNTCRSGMHRAASTRTLHEVSLHLDLLSPPCTSTPKLVLTHGDSQEPSPSKGDAVPVTAEKKLTSVECGAEDSVDQDSYTVNEPSGIYDYGLTSVLSHIGSSMCHGHYISNSADQNGNWLSYDDKMVKQTDLESVLSLRANCAYLLFYEHRGAGK